MSARFSPRSVSLVLRNRQRYLRSRPAAMKRLASFFLEKAVRLDAALSGADVTILLMDDRGMRRLNRRFLGHDETTDVLCFRYPALPAGPDAGVGAPSPAGDCFLNAQQALRLGPRFGGPARELALYLAHAIDHLAGHDDATGEQRRRMRRRETRWLREAARRGLLLKEELPCP